jgi:hypothetical protein
MHNSKILVAICDYGGRYSTKLVKESLEKFSNFTIKIFSTKNGDFLFPSEIGEDLPFTHRQYFVDNIDNYDYFFYTENDIIYPEECINFLFSIFNKFGKNKPVGFIRHEDDQLIDIGAILCQNTPNILIENNNQYFRLSNDHQGSYFLSRDQLKLCINSGNYLIKPQSSGGYGKLETGASNVYYECGIEKVYPKDGFKNLLVKHCENKWIFLQPSFTIYDLNLILTNEYNKSKLHTKM